MDEVFIFYLMAIHCHLLEQLPSPEFLYVINRTVEMNWNRENSGCSKGGAMGIININITH